MKFKFLTKSTEYLGISPHRTVVLIGNDEGASIPYYLDTEAINLTDSELFDMAMEKMYQENFPNRAENEKFNLLGEKIAKYDELIEKSQNAIKDMEESTAEAKAAIIKNDEAINNVVSELTEFAIGIIVKKGIFTMKFTKTHQIVKSWVALVLVGTYTEDQVPKLFNLREVVIEVLSVQAAEAPNKVNV